MLTIRNWLIGFYVIEYEQRGEDRATYGDRLLEKLSEKLSSRNIRGMTTPELSRYRQFASIYFRFGSEVQLILNQHRRNLGTLSQDFNKQVVFHITGSVTENSKDREVPTKILLTKLAFSHFVELIKINETEKRLFYEVECINGTWSVRELKRQINSLYFERCGISGKPELLQRQLSEENNSSAPAHFIKDIYAFEFLGLPIKDAVEESDLQSALLGHLHEFILELGNGFCLEARQKRILIGDEYFFIDLVFYHRLLRCHVLVELKIDAFNHSNAGQLNTYLNYYNEEIKQKGDNDPIWILMVTDKNNALVKYATAGMDQNLFVSKYLVQLPPVHQLENFIKKELKHI